MQYRKHSTDNYCAKETEQQQQKQQQKIDGEMKNWWNFETRQCYGRKNEPHKLIFRNLKWGSDENKKVREVDENKWLSCI